VAFTDQPGRSIGAQILEAVQQRAASGQPFDAAWAQNLWQQAGLSPEQAQAANNFSRQFQAGNGAMNESQLNGLVGTLKAGQTPTEAMFKPQAPAPAPAAPPTFTAPVPLSAGTSLGANGSSSAQPAQPAPAPAPTPAPAPQPAPQQQPTYTAPPAPAFTDQPGHSIGAQLMQAVQQRVASGQPLDQGWAEGLWQRAGLTPQQAQAANAFARQYQAGNGTMNEQQLNGLVGVMRSGQTPTEAMFTPMAQAHGGPALAAAPNNPAQQAAQQPAAGPGFTDQPNHSIGAQIIEAGQQRASSGQPFDQSWAEGVWRQAGLTPEQASQANAFAHQWSAQNGGQSMNEGQLNGLLGTIKAGQAPNAGMFKPPAPQPQQPQAPQQPPQTQQPQPPQQPAPVQPWPQQPQQPSYNPYQPSPYQPYYGPSNLDPTQSPYFNLGFYGASGGQTNPFSYPGSYPQGYDPNSQVIGQTYPSYYGQGSYSSSQGYYGQPVTGGYQFAPGETMQPGMIYAESYGNGGDGSTQLPGGGQMYNGPIQWNYASQAGGQGGYPTGYQTQATPGYPAGYGPQNAPYYGQQQSGYGNQSSYGNQSGYGAGYGQQQGSSSQVYYGKQQGSQSGSPTQWGSGWSGQSQPSGQAAYGPVANPPGYNGAGDAYGQGNVYQRYLDGLPAPNKINPVNWGKMDQPTRDFMTSAYEQKGYDPATIQGTVKNMLPQFHGPGVGLMS
jgi:hypothetical protein